MVAKKKYVVCPGWVTSKTDGDRHYIGVSQLIRLYNVNPKECVAWKRGTPDRIYDGLIRLYPRYSGDYTLPIGREREEDENA